MAALIIHLAVDNLLHGSYPGVDMSLINIYASIGEEVLENKKKILLHAPTQYKDKLSMPVILRN